MYIIMAWMHTRGPPCGLHKKIPASFPCIQHTIDDKQQQIYIYIYN